jgi:hypothetical protein
MSYANVQGKEALIEKFRSSSVMDERIEYQPRLFHSSGPNIGQPQPFPGQSTYAFLCSLATVRSFGALL